MVLGKSFQKDKTKVCTKLEFLKFRIVKIKLETQRTKIHSMYIGNTKQHLLFKR